MEDQLLHQRAPTPGLAGVAMSLVVEDVDQMTAAAAAVGAVVLGPPADQPWGERQSVLTDADGHVFYLARPFPVSPPEVTLDHRPGERLEARPS